MGVFMLLYSVLAPQSSEAYVAALIGLMSGAQRVIDEIEHVRENNEAYLTLPLAFSLGWRHLLVFSPV